MKELRNALMAQIEKRQEFIDTNEFGEDEYLSYHALPLFDTIIVLEDYTGDIENNTEFLVYDAVKDTLRTCTSAEDNFMRAGDQEADPFLEYDCDFIISKDHEGINRWTPDGVTHEKI